MAGQTVNWMDYSGLASAGGPNAEGLEQGYISAEELNALHKALAAGADINAPGSFSAGDGFALRVESLDQTLYNVTYKAKDIAFWRALYKDPAYNTVEEYNRLESYGSGVAAFIAEGDLPATDDSVYSRQYTKIKFMGTTRAVTHVMSLLRVAHGDVIARETVNGTLWLLRQLERKLFEGDEDLVDVEFDGLEKLLTSAWGTTVEADGYISGWADSDHVIDLRGEPLTEDHIIDLAERLAREPNYGAPSDLWLPTGPVKDLNKILYPKERYNIPAPVGGMAGISINGLTTPFGDIRLNPDIFIPVSTTPNSSAVGSSSSRPASPTVNSITAAPEGTSKFDSGDAGTYIYKIVACNRYGKSAPVQTNSVTVAKGDKVTINVTEGSPAPSYYEIYRTAAGGAASTARLIMRVPRSGATQDIVDINRFLPDTARGYMLTQSPEVLKWKQLAPFTKIPLATIDTSIRWMQVLYGALQVMKPLQCGMFINIGKLQTGAEAG